MLIETKDAMAFVSEWFEAFRKGHGHEKSLPKRSFYYKATDGAYSVCDNSTGHCICEDFKTEREAQAYLKDWSLSSAFSRCYISGPISGVLNLNRAAFKRAESYLIGQGLEPVNPLDLGHSECDSWAECMRRDIKALMTCDAIYMLKGYLQSAGAMIEYKLATELGYKLFFERHIKEV